ncbi:phosphopantetheine-binding protein [Streptomyces europaeiscabiei]|uniref:phosphopantetheine-binding protein n=1 Tax=Streptomyces europaeiscabiei TaxID=146819 RepID=UPI0029AF73F9|nr:phosphopantetheine-binding protein [Streptomyces europaeiscabiei]MDX2525276.1 phosphopantetheine-binding protein [Streptomyces europaeiscabiei]
MTHYSWPTEFEKIVREQLLLLSPSDPIPLDRSLFELGLDSVGAVTLLAELEDTFGIEFDDELLDVELFSTVTHLWRAVENK